MGEQAVWTAGQIDRYRRAINETWDDFEDAYDATIKRVGLQSMAAMHAKRYQERERMLKSMVDGLLARPTRTAETPDAIRRAVAELLQFKRNLGELQHAAALPDPLAHRFSGRGILRAMTDPNTPARTPHSAPPVPAAPRRRPSEERAAVAASSRTATQLAAVAIVIAVVALGLAVWKMLAPAAASCQGDAWSAAPAADQMPSQWAVKGATFDISRRTTSFVGPDPGDGSGSVPTVLGTVTCYPDGASDAVSRSETVARSIGEVVSDRPDLGDQGFQATDASGAIFVQFRHGAIVVDLAAGGGSTQSDIDSLASGYDRALGGDGGNIASDEPVASGGDVASPGASGDAGASASPAAPELEKLLPSKVGTVDLTVDSALGSTVLQSDQGSRAIIAALRAAGKGPDALRLGEAYDATQNTDLNMLAVTVDGMDVAKVRQLVLDSWLAASGAGVTQSQVTLAGKEYTKVDLGDEGPVDYVRTKDGVVFVITTSDPALAEQSAALLP